MYAPSNVRCSARSSTISADDSTGSGVLRRLGWERRRGKRECKYKRKCECECEGEGEGEGKGECGLA